jgi:hypothetical protein
MVNSKLTQLEDAYSDLYTAYKRCCDVRDTCRLLLKETEEPSFFGSEGALSSAIVNIDVAMDNIRGEIDKLELDDDG